MLRKFGILFVVLALLVVAGAAFAFAAGMSGTSGAPSVGYGAKVVSGYTVDSIAYTYTSATDLSGITQIAFNINDAATHVKIQTASGGTVIDCTLGTASGGKKAVTCDTTGLATTNLTALNIFADDIP